MVSAAVRSKAAILLMFLLCVGESLFFGVVLCVLSSLTIILVRKRELVVTSLNSCCRVAISVQCLFLVVHMGWSMLWFVIVVLRGHTNFLIN